jgi:hypothetical protein
MLFRTLLFLRKRLPYSFLEPDDTKSCCIGNRRRNVRI